MFKPIPGNHKFIISLSGIIRNSNGTKCDLPVKNNFITIEFYQKIETLDIKWLSLLSHFEIDLPKQYRQILFTECNPVAIKSNSGYFAFTKNPIYINRKYRIIPTYSKYAISANGSILDIEQNKEINVNFSKSDYPSVYIYDPDRGYFRHICVHRLVALAWKGNDDYILKPIVNHIDGNKENYHYHNLEWCSYSENNFHAMHMGLRRNNTTIQVKNIEDGSIKEYKSFNSFCKEKNINARSVNINRNLKLKPNIYFNKFEIRRHGDNRPWLSDNDLLIKKNKYTITIQFPNSEVEIIHTVSDLMKRLKIWNSGFNIRNIVAKAKIKYPGIKIDFVENFSTNPVQSMNINTGEVIEANSIRELARKTDVGFSTIKKALDTGKSYICKNHVFRFKNDKPWDTPLKNPKSAKEIIARNLKNNEVLDFQSLQSFCDYFNISPHSGKCILNNKFKINDWEISENDYKY